MSDTVNLTDDQQVEVCIQTFESACLVLEEKGIDPAILDSVLFAMFAKRMQEANARDEFEEILEIALDTGWEDIPPTTYH